jgi:dihydroorotate dehydrogenase
MRGLRSPRFFIAAPFGNYISHPSAISVHGTFTLQPNGNRLLAALKSLRYRPALNGWTNKLGLPNPGIKAALAKTTPDHLLSIAELQRNDFTHIFELLPPNQNIELNLSCPNLAKTLPWDNANIFTKTKRTFTIAKLSPTTKPEEIKYLYDAGFRQFHFSNTLQTIHGGLSGPELRPFTLELIRITREDMPSDIEIIAGGGVQTERDVKEYMDAGANHISIGTLCFNPFKMRRLLGG